MASKSKPSQASRLGRRVPVSTVGEEVEAFVPPPLPPTPPLRVKQLYGLLEEAMLGIGRLRGVGAMLPDEALFLYTYVRKEALLSAQIEGTQSSLSELLRHENAALPGVPADADVQEVSNYVAAAGHGLQRMADGLPVSVRLICEMHALLLQQGRGQQAQSGAFRRSQNWIGGTRPGNAHFVPPPPQLVPALMSDLEKFVHAETPPLPYLARIGMAHVQFETIHPFLDGNGRLGRLLIPLLLVSKGMLDQPMLYLSLYFKARRDEYYALLQRVRTHGDWEAWLRFFLAGVAETSHQAADTATELLRLFDDDKRRIEALGRPSATALRLHQLLQERPLTTVAQASARLGASRPTVAKSIANLARLGILDEITGARRGRIYAYRAYLSVLERGTEPLAT